MEHKVPPIKRDIGIAYILWLFLGIQGGHKFYLEKIGMGLLYFFTGGLFFIGWFIDLFTLPRQVNRFNEKNSKPQVTPKITNPNQIEQTILKVAQRKNGLVTPMEIAVDNPITLDDAKKELDRMVNKGFADVEVSQTGIVVYRLFGFQDETQDPERLFDQPG
jgi:hypothetical protein